MAAHTRFIELLCGSTKMSKKRWMAAVIAEAKKCEVAQEALPFTRQARRLKRLEANERPITKWAPVAVRS